MVIRLTKFDLAHQEFPVERFPTSVYREDVFVCLGWRKPPPVKLYRLLSDDVMGFIADRIGDPLSEFGMQSFDDIVENVFLYDLENGRALRKELMPQKAV